MHKIKILEGTYKIRGKDVELAGMVFPMVEEFKVGSQGGYVTVDGTAVAGFPDRNIKIKVDSAESYQKVNSNTKVTAREESDEEVIDRLRERFDILEDMTKACKKGDVRAMIVSGPPGVGKSFGVEKVLGKHELIAQLGDRPAKYQVVKGAMSAIGLYCKLYNYADKDNVLVFDDCDSVLLDDLSLNILKAALDSKQKRTIHWNTDSFGMLAEYKFTEEQHQDVVDFIDVNKSKLRELSLRTVLKVADLAKAFPDRWEAMAESTVLQRA